MSSKLESAQQLIVERIAELDEEREQLLKVLERLNDTAAPKPGSAGSNNQVARLSRGRGSSGRRARRGQRERELLASIEADSSRRVSDHARQIGVSPQQLYPIIKRLTEQQRLEKVEGRYRLKA
jgi:predicted Rossmann fold nucleotide-binding protein DprA/Smf involved in DNA uptake